MQAMKEVRSQDSKVPPVQRGVLRQLGCAPPRGALQLGLQSLLPRKTWAGLAFWLQGKTFLQEAAALHVAAAALALAALHRHH